MTRLLVTGASGLLGLNLALQTTDRYEVVGVTHAHDLAGVPFAVKRVDLSQPGEGTRLLEKVRPDVLVHCAAVANLEAAEADPALAERLNARLPGELAAACSRLGVRMVHISTDAVFDGQKGYYRETDMPKPLGVYACSKLAGEQAVTSANPQALIARVNFYGWSLRGQRSLAEFFFNNLSAGRQVKGWTDVNFCPMQVNDLADVLLALVEQNASGLYHVVGSDCLSKYDFGVAIARQFGFDPALVLPTSWADGGLKASRSPDLSLNTDKLAASLGYPPPGLQAGLERFHRLYLDGYPRRLHSLSA
jgi:dTDP-4-dehydrorhamnose reductase